MYLINPLMLIKIVLIIISIIFLIIIKFLYDREKMRRRISKSGGMKKRYSAITGQILASFPNSEISRISKDSIHITWETRSSMNYFAIIEAFNDVMIRWQENTSIGKNEGAWDVKVNFDQMENSKRIIDEIKSYG